MKAKTASLLILIFFASPCLSAQSTGSDKPVIRENEKGEKIIVYPDGSWQYFNRFSTDGQVLFDPQDAGDSPQDEQQKDFPVFSGDITPYDQPVNLTEDDARRIAERQAQLAREALAIAEERAREASAKRRAVEEQLASARREERAEWRQLNIRLEAAQQAEARTAREAQLAQAEYRRAETFTEKGNFLEELKARKDRPLQLPGNNSELRGNFYENIAFVDVSRRHLPDRQNLRVRPPEPPCHFAFNGTDQRTGAQRRDLEKSLLFTHTDERLRIYLKEKEYLRCEGFLTSLAGGYRFLSLQFTFAYPNAREAYGFIEKGSVLTIKLLNGDFVNLRSGKMDQGSYNTEEDILTYRVHYPIAPNQISLLRQSEVDSILVFWSSGYEAYDVYNVDFFINQIDCLDNY